MKWIRTFVLLLLIALMATGCGGGSPEAEGNREASPEAATPAPGPGGSDQGGEQNGDKAQPEDLAPDFSVETFEGNTFKLSEHRGMPVVLNFWESW
jgi:cytochrome oxidase Cu insertion factor (SCO1/SenC/PrrC family)